MGRLGDLFAPSDVGYPGAPGSGRTTGNVSNGNYQPLSSTSFFNRFFAPTDLPYPLPTFGVGTGRGNAGGQVTPTPPVSSSAPVSSAPVPPPANPAPVVSTSAPSAPTPSTPATPAPAPSPVTVIVQPFPPSASPAGGSSGGDGGASASMPVGNCPVAPTQTVVTAFSTNPRLRARHPRAQEVLVEEMLDENLTVRMLSKDGAPVSFVVPDGCNAVDFTFGAIELNPGHGHDDDLDEVVTVGAINDGDIANGVALKPGDEISVVVPWRHGSWVELAADRLRLPIYARFFQIETA